VASLLRKTAGAYQTARWRRDVAPLRDRGQQATISGDIIDAHALRVFATYQHGARLAATLRSNAPARVTKNSKHRAAHRIDMARAGALKNDITRFCGTARGMTSCVVDGGA